MVPLGPQDDKVRLRMVPVWIEWRLVLPEGEREWEGEAFPRR